MAEDKIDLENDPAFQLADMPTYLSKGVVAGMSQHKETGQQIVTLVQTVQLNGEFIAVAQPMDIPGIDALIRSLMGLKQQLTTISVQAVSKLWTTQKPTDSTMPGQLGTALEKGHGFKTVMDVYRAGPTAVNKLLGYGQDPEDGRTCEAKLHKWFKSHEIAWPDPQDNPMDPRNEGD